MTRTVAAYSETLRVPVSWWLLGLGFAGSVAWVFLVAVTWQAATAAGLLAGVLVTVGLVRYGSTQILVDEDGLHVGRAHLPWQHVGTAAALDGSHTRAAIGVDADARAYLVLRAYCRGSVTVQVADDADPTPYWLVSTRRPVELARCLTARSVQD